MSSDNTDPRTVEMPEWLPDNPCSEEAHQMVFEQSDCNLEQTQITAYMSGFFEGEGCISTAPDYQPASEITHNLVPQVIIKTARRQMAGLFDAEGCVKLDVCGSQDRSISHEVTPAVGMKQVQDKTLLEVIFDKYCDISNVKYSVHKRERDKNRQPTVRATVRGADSIRNFLTPLLPLLYEKRRQAVIMVREILPRYEDGVHLTKEGFIEMMKWKRELDREKPMGQGDRKYTVEYFKELWGDEISAQQRIGAYTD
jgi:hypothetical protein